MSLWSGRTTKRALTSIRGSLSKFNQPAKFFTRGRIKTDSSRNFRSVAQVSQISDDGSVDGFQLQLRIGSEFVLQDISKPFGIILEKCRWNKRLSRLSIFCRILSQYSWRHHWAAVWAGGPQKVRLWNDDLQPPSGNVPSSAVWRDRNWFAFEVGWIFFSLSYQDTKDRISRS